MPVHVRYKTTVLLYLNWLRIPKMPIINQVKKLSFEQRTKTVKLTRIISSAL